MEYLKNGCGAIAAERDRQVNIEGFGDIDDDALPAGVLAAAGECYALAAVMQLRGEKLPDLHLRPVGWFLDGHWWKPSEDPLRNLVKAGALLAAEIDRSRRLHSTV